MKRRIINTFVIPGLVLAISIGACGIFGKFERAYETGIAENNTLQERIKELQEINDSLERENSLLHNDLELYKTKVEITEQDILDFYEE